MRNFELLQDRGGNVAMMFAILLVPLLIGGGMAIDFMRASEVRTDLAEAADAGLLVAARAKLKDDTLTEADLTALARKHFDANRGGGIGVEIDTFEFSFDPATKAASLNAVGRVRTSIMGVVGKPYMTLDILSEAEVVKPRALEVVLALDNTGSMDGAKLLALKDSARDLVEAIMADTDNEVKVGLAPFARHVNVGVSRAGEAWLDIPPDSVWNENACTVDTAAASAAGCSEQASTCTYDGTPYACDKWICPSGDPPTNCSIVVHPTTFLGCVGSRDGALRIKDSNYISNPIPGILNASPWPDCPNEVTPMTTNKTAVLDDIDDLAVVGETYIPSGLFWAQALISSEEPFTEGKTYDAIAAESGVKAIVLMTDGENTASAQASGDHYGSDADDADQVTLDACEEIKDKGIILYTIAFEVHDADTQEMLDDCATSSDSYFNAADAADLAEAFGEIGNNLQELALTK